MDKLVALGIIAKKLEIRHRERFGITQGLRPELEAYMNILAQWHAVQRYPEDQRGIKEQAEAHFKNFFIVFEVCILKYGEVGKTLKSTVLEQLQSLRLPQEIIDQASNYIKFTENSELRQIKRDNSEIYALKNKNSTIF